MDAGAMQEHIFGEFSADLVIPCIVDGNPPPQIKWYKLSGESQIPVSYGDRYTLAADNSLHIKSMLLKFTISNDHEFDNPNMILLFKI